MKIAITTWGNRVSPVFDAAQTLLIADIENQSIHNKKYESFQPDDIIALAALLNRENVTALVCGAISETYATRLIENRIRMFAFVTGNTMDILNCLAINNIIKPAFMMPGCTPMPGTPLA
ncbi:NifB/NifX family molybdenum-iron cluster-binding protein [uncultured Desulfobacter sp.]|uniref:NifB/NifX family molybdenum-iron cluster-binding protein n=1 Tax=uncultured Desulfobacter sp. TaxID=240139 RepID=UPI0029C83541|nr:NifB/NifX family molybdenum-iron cluster-binding protein [uncultured Desulfobacter sp.]